MLRIVFWVSGALFVFGAALSGALLAESRDTSSGSGMAFIFFLPIMVLALVAGGAVAYIRFTRPGSLSSWEQRFALGVSVGVVAGVIGLVLLIVAD